MIITDSKKIKFVQEEFNKKYPALKLEFYRSKHATGEGNTNKEKLDFNKTIGEVRTLHKSGDMAINPEMLVSALEQEFENTYGLHVQVFRKSGTLWLQTTATDSWSLGAQEKAGEVDHSRRNPE